MRTDIHTPSAIIPSDYNEVAIWAMNIVGIGDAEFMLRERETIRRHMERTGGTYAHVDTTGSCQVCGNVQAIYLVLFYHEKSNAYIRVGMDCAMKLGMSGDEGKWNLFRKNVRDAREAQAGKKKALAILEQAGLGLAWDVYIEPCPAHIDGCPAKGRNSYGDDNGVEYACNCEFEARFRVWDMWEERTIRDIVGKLVKYGSISDKAAAFVGSLLNKIAQRPIVEAQRKAEREAAAPCPTGRIRITGTVVGTKTVEDRFDRYGSGEMTKIIVKDASGFVVYGSQFQCVGKGASVDFVATITVSDKDPKFGFFKRPVPYVEKIDKATAKFLTTVAWG